MQNWQATHEYISKYVGGESPWPDFVWTTDVQYLYLRLKSIE